MREAIAGRFVGARVRRVEDRRLLTGHGRYVDDVSVAGMAHATFLRSPHPHAVITRIDVSRTKDMPGVLAVFTGTDIKRMTNPCMGMLALDGLYDPVFYALAIDRVRLVGDPVAMVVAESRAVAEDACELIDVEYEPLPAVATIEQGLDPSRPAIWPKAKSNIVYEGGETYGDVDSAFARAEKVITRTFHQHRLSNQPMETRGSVAEIDPRTGALTFHSATQSAHLLKWALALCVGRSPVWRSLKELATHRDRVSRFVKGARAFTTSKPELGDVSKEMTPVFMKQAAKDPMRVVRLTEALLALLAKDPTTLPRVVAGDIGGAFGAKTCVNREDIALCAAAIKLGRSIKWIEDRNEHLMVGGHAREEDVEISAAVANDGTLLGMRVQLTMDSGAYPAFPFGAPLFAQIVRVLMPGPYRVPAFQFSGRLIASNKGTYVPYRGPWAVETWVRERMLDVIAEEVGISRAEIRLRNIVGPDELPTPMVTGPMLDERMSARRTLVEALDIADFAGWEAAKQRARGEGRIVGLGFATFIEPAPGPRGYFDFVIPGFGAMAGMEPARTVLEADGSVSVVTPQMPHGQGHETTLAQVAADELGLPIESVRVRYGDTAVTPFSLVGTGGSRSATMAGGAVTFAARALRREVIDVAADLLEASPDDLVIEDGAIHVAGTPAVHVSFPAVATEALRRGTGAPPGEAIRAIGEFDGAEGGWSQATHVCWVEIDPETGLVTIPRYLVAEDCGELINPAIVDGQIRGGVAQGIGAVLYERAAYDDVGQFQAGTFMDYLLPTAMEIPDIEIHHIETPSDVVANYRGVGEGGMIAAPAALTNAISDALGVQLTEQYLPPSRILELAGIINR